MAVLQIDRRDAGAVDDPPEGSETATKLSSREHSGQKIADCSAHRHIQVRSGESRVERRVSRLLKMADQLIARQMARTGVKFRSNRRAFANGAGHPQARMAGAD